MDDFNKNMVQWINYDNEIKKYSEKVKSLRSEKNTFEWLPQDNPIKIDAHKNDTEKIIEIINNHDQGQLC